MRIAVDAMGGDHAPEEIIKGTLMAAETWPDLNLILVGQLERILPFFINPRPANISFVEASEEIRMDEYPAIAVRKKKGASIVVATGLVSLGKADAVVSAGSTGAQMAAALLGLGRIKGIERPAIAAILPTLEGGKLILDVGANLNASPGHLCQYALMGNVYAEKILGNPCPRVGLLNVGSEEIKGNELMQKTFSLLKAAPLNFIGNVEGRDVPYGRADVVVCEGFAGNILLKTAEGLAEVLFQLFKERITSNIIRKLGVIAIKPGIKEIAQILDYAEYGGAPLLGVNGISIICHGSSKAKSIFNAIRVAQECVQVRLIEQIREDLPNYMMYKI